MPQIKLASKVATAAMDALDRHIPRLYATLGTRIVVIAEPCAKERTEVAGDEEGKETVTLQIKHLEVAGDEQEDAIRQALRALHTQRTAYGKLTEHLDVELSEHTIRRCAGDITAIEAARLQVVVDHWGHYTATALHNEKLTVSDLRRELETIRDGLRIAAGLSVA
jgi:hypothetical protein